MRGATNSNGYIAKRGTFNLPTPQFPSGARGNYVEINGWCMIRIWGETPTTTFSDLTITNDVLPPMDPDGYCRAPVGGDTAGQIYTNGNNGQHCILRMTVTTTAIKYCSLIYPVKGGGRKLISRILSFFGRCRR